MAHLLQPSPDWCPSSTKKTDSSFKGRGFSFIPVRPAHLDFLGFMFDEEPPPFERCFGNSMVDREFLPLGFCLAWLREEGSTTIHAYYGHWLQVFPKEILRSMRGMMDRVRSAGISEVWAIADERVPGSDKLLKWFGGAPSGQIVPGQGEYWRVDLTRTPI